MRFEFRINEIEVTLAFRAGEGNRFELIAIDAQVGEFYVSEEDQIEAVRFGDDAEDEGFTLKPRGSFSLFRLIDSASAALRR